MKPAACLVCQALAFVLAVAHSSGVADEQIVEVRVTAKEVDDQAAGGRPNEPSQGRDKTSQARNVEARAIYVDVKDGDQDFKLVLRGDDAVEAIIEEVEEQLKKAGVLEKVIEKVRDILKHHRSGKRNYWYYPKDDGDKDANNKRRSHAIIEWHSDGAQLYRIGLNSSEVGASLRSHLGLDGGGLVVQSVLADSPADAAGLKTHDIIVKVDNAAVANQQALIEAVQVAGKENQQLRLFIIRGGSPKTVKIKPRERNTVRLEVRNLPAAISVARPHVIHRIVGEADFTAPRRVRLHSVGPAYMIAKDTHNPSISIQSLSREIRELEKQVQGLQEAIKSLADHLPKD